MSVIAPHGVDWVAAGPLWSAAAEAAGAVNGTAAMRQPALLTIADDNFMDVLAQQLASDPASLGAMLARPISYRVRPPGRPADWEPDPAAVPLKLYQAAHGQFNLVVSELVCRVPGLPDHAVHPELKEQTAFVIRKVDSSSVEYAWAPVTSAAGASSSAPATVTSAPAMAWQAIPAGSEGSIATGEQLQPLFPVSYTLDTLARKLFVGVVPTSSVETYNQASTTQPPAPSGSPPSSSSSSSSSPPSPALMEMAFNTRVAKPVYQTAQLVVEGSTFAAEAAAGSPMLVLEFASFLNDWFPTSWPEVASGTAPSVNAGLYAWLWASVADTDTGISWGDALVDAWNQKEFIVGEAESPPSGQVVLALNVANTAVTADDLAYRISLTTPETDGTTVPGSVCAKAPKLDPRDTPQYVLRCLYRRPQCPGKSDLVSAATAPFQIATFFDFDAPARPVTISLPQVTGVADLRKFRKNVNFLISQELHGQLDRIIDLKNTMNGTLNQPDGGGGLSVAWICSFSIPIITICALFVLIMFVIMLNLVFWWLPFFEICLPVPE